MENLGKFNSGKVRKWGRLNKVRVKIQDPHIVNNHTKRCVHINYSL